MSAVKSVRWGGGLTAVKSVSYRVQRPQRNVLLSGVWSVGSWMFDFDVEREEEGP